MKRKLVLIGALTLFVVSMRAEDLNVLTMNFQPWGNTQFDVKTMKITWDNEWEGGGWWLARDCSEYECAIVEFKEPIPMDVVITVIYSAKDEMNEKLKSKKTLLAGKEQITIVLDPTYKVSVEGICISGSSPGYVIMKTLVLKKEQ